MGNVGSNLNTILETKWSTGKTPIVSSNLTLVTTLGKLYTEVPTRTGATWQNKVPRMFSGVQHTTGIEQKCLWVVGAYGISPVGKDKAWKSAAVLETHTLF